MRVSEKKLYLVLAVLLALIILARKKRPPVAPVPTVRPVATAAPAPGAKPSPRASVTTTAPMWYGPSPVPVPATSPTLFRQAQKVPETPAPEPSAPRKKGDCRRPKNYTCYHEMTANVDKPVTTESVECIAVASLKTKACVKVETMRMPLEKGTDDQLPYNCLFNDSGSDAGVSEGEGRDLTAALKSAVRACLKAAK